MRWSKENLSARAEACWKQVNKWSCRLRVKVLPGNDGTMRCISFHFKVLWDKYNSSSNLCSGIIYLCIYFLHSHHGLQSGTLASLWESSGSNPSWVEVHFPLVHARVFSGNSSFLPPSKNMLLGFNHPCDWGCGQATDWRSVKVVPCLCPWVAGLAPADPERD